MAAKRPDPGADDRRRQARAAQAAAAARTKRRRTITQVAIIGGVAVVVIAIIATAVVLGNRGKTTAAGPAGGAPASTATTTVGGASVPFSIGGTGDTANGVRVGAADAKVKVDLWVDYSCPHCQEFEATNNDVLTGLVAAGNVAVTYHNIQIVTDYGTEAGSAAACMAVHDPSAWPAFNAALYANHTAQTDSWTSTDFSQFAASSGAGSATRSCIENGTYKSWITANTAASAKAGVTGTPTMLIDGQKTDTLSGQALTDRVHQLASA